MSIDERLDLERDDRRHESTQARLGGRLKFEFCHWCGRPDGMKSVHRETLEVMEVAAIAPLAWYRERGNAEYLFYPCSECNRYWTIPDGFMLMLLGDVLEWRGTLIDPMAPDYEALAAEPKPRSRITDSRESAGI